MARNMLFALVFVFMFGSAMSTSAQDANASKSVCDIESLQNIINLFIGELGKLKTGSETDPVKIADKLQQLANDANMLRTACDGLVFSGESSKVIGPVQLPVGVYRAKATTAGYLIVHVTAVDGECGAGTRYLSEGLFSISRGEAANGAEAIFTSKGCTALIEFSNVRDNWELSFERLTSS